MPIVQKVQNADYARHLADQLASEVQDWYIPGANGGISAEVRTAETFEEAGVSTRDGGVVLQLSDGTEVRLTVQAYRPTEES